MREKERLRMRKNCMVKSIEALTEFPWDNNILMR